MAENDGNENKLKRPSRNNSREFRNITTCGNNSRPRSSNRIETKANINFKNSFMRNSNNFEFSNKEENLIKNIKKREASKSSNSTKHL